jgi:hypothetical protein
MMKAKTTNRKRTKVIKKFSSNHSNPFDKQLLSKKVKQLKQKQRQQRKLHQANISITQKRNSIVSIKNQNLIIQS